MHLNYFAIFDGVSTDHPAYFNRAIAGNVLLIVRRKYEK